MKDFAEEIEICILNEGSKYEQLRSLAQEGRVRGIAAVVRDYAREYCRKWGMSATYPYISLSQSVEIARNIIAYHTEE